MNFRRPHGTSAKAQGQRRVENARTEGKREVLMSARVAKRHLTQSVMERYLLNAVGEDVTLGLQAHLRMCTNCRNELRSLEALYREFNEKVLPRTLDRVVRRLAKTTDSVGGDSGEFDDVQTDPG